ncbi:MAG: hypothetical protein V1493_01395 [Candidatus Diapherotrites archaeon]
MGGKRGIRRRPGFTGPGRVSNWNQAREIAGITGTKLGHSSDTIRLMLFKGLLSAREAALVENDLFVRSGKKDSKETRAAARANVRLHMDLVRWLKSGGSKKYRRHLVSKEKAPELMRELEGKLSNPEFFGSLPRIGSAEYVALYWFKGIPVAVKLGARTGEHGLNPGEMTAALKTYREETRKKEITTASGQPVQELFSRSVLPQVYGVTKGYLVMEYMSGIDARQAGRYLEGYLQYSYEKAYSEVKENWHALRSAGRINESRRLQALQALVLGNTNPKNPSRGRWFFMMPRDFY